MSRKVVLSESQKLILMGSITKSMLALSLLLLPTLVDTGSLRRKKKRLRINFCPTAKYNVYYKE